MTQIKNILDSNNNIFNKKLHSIQDKLEYNKSHLLEYRDKTDWVKTGIFEIAKQIDE